MKKLLLALLILASTAAVTAQTTSTIEGTVRDPGGAAVADATVTIAGPAVERTVKSDQEGRYQILAVPPGPLHAHRVARGLRHRHADRPRGRPQPHAGPRRRPVGGLDPADHRGHRRDTAARPHLPGDRRRGHPRADGESAGQRGNYLDLVQLVPGVTVNRAADEGSDLVTPILGERGGQHHPPGRRHAQPQTSSAVARPAQFNQNSIFEFEVITDGYKAEFGHGSGGVINVVTKSGQSDWRTMAAGFWRDDSLDSSNSLEDGEDAPELDRWTWRRTSAARCSGTASSCSPRPRASKRIASSTSRSRRRLRSPSATSRTPSTSPLTDEQTRLFARFDEQIGDEPPAHPVGAAATSWTSPTSFLSPWPPTCRRPAAPSSASAP